MTKRGEILFPVYNGGEAGLLYSADSGKSFRRSPGVRGSESQAVELPSGKLRLFLRNPSGFLSYADFARRDGGFVPVKEVRTGYALASNCMASAIAFEKEGKTKLALSAPSGEGLWTGRYGGRITLFDLDENEELIPASEIAVGKKEDFFAYSCLAALPGGKAPAPAGRILPHAGGVERWGSGFQAGFWNGTAGFPGGIQDLVAGLCPSACGLPLSWGGAGKQP